MRRPGSAHLSLDCHSFGAFFRWNPGFHSQRHVTLPDNRRLQVACIVTAGADKEPTFSCQYAAIDVNEQEQQLEGELSGPHPSLVVKALFSQLGMQRYHHSGEDFFGLSVKAVRDRLQVAEDKAPTMPPTVPRQMEEEPSTKRSTLWRQGYMTAKRSLSKPFDSITPPSQLRRLKLGVSLLKELLNDNISHFVAHLLVKVPRFVKEGIAHFTRHRQAAEVLQSLVGQFTNSAPGRKAVHSLRESAQVLISTSMSQRSYNILKRLFKIKDVHLKIYAAVSTYIKSLDVGEIRRKEHACPPRVTALGDCMCVSASTTDTLQHVFKSAHLFKRMSFVEAGKQAALFEQLKQIDSHLYSGPNVLRRTIFLRQTGDNYRSFRLPMQQMSFNIMNMKSLLNSPLGQFIQCLWRGQEKREALVSHCTALFSELESLTQSGVKLTLPCGTMEEFNVVVIYVADLSHMEKVMGRVSCTAKYGCMRCKKPSSAWAHIAEDSDDNDSVQTEGSLLAEELTVAEMVHHGQVVEKELGLHPREDSRAYTNFHQAHFGQVAPVLLPFLSAEDHPTLLTPPHTLGTPRVLENNSLIHETQTARTFNHSHPEANGLPVYGLSARKLF